MIGQKKSFQVIRNVSIPSTAIAGPRGRDARRDQKIRSGLAPSIVRGLDQLVGHRAGEVLAHEEDAERRAPASAGSPPGGGRPGRAAPSHVERDDAQLRRHHHRADADAEQQVAPAEAQLGEGEAGQRAEGDRAERDRAGDDQRVDQALVERRQLERLAACCRRATRGQQRRRRRRPSRRWCATPSRSCSRAGRPTRA